MNPFYPDGPRPDMSMSHEEKALKAKRFRKWATLADIFTVLPVVLALALLCLSRSPVRIPLALVFGLAGAFLLSLLVLLLAQTMAFQRCPFCGRRFHRWDWTMAPFKWRWSRCPDCDFTPGWGGKG